MEENVALDSKKQKKFDKSIKGIKKLLKKNEAKPHKPAVLAPKDDDGKDDQKKKRHKERGLVYLAHIPHGFYEHEMTQYFRQFGVVTGVRVVRSPRSGRSRGFAFVQFRDAAVAEVVADTMHNYLMGKRLIKAAIVPPEKQKFKAFKKRWSIKNNPTTNRRIKERKAHNAPKTDAEHLTKAKKMLANLKKNKKKLSDLGIDYSFFTPVDVPKELSEKVESENKKVKVKSESKAKINNEPDAKQNKNKKSKAKDTEEKLTKGGKKVETKSKSEPRSKKEVKVQETDKAKQNEKQKKMQNAGVRLPENFIKVGEESGEESDGSLDFDSDEYEKMLENDSDASSGEESDDDDGEGESGDGEEGSDDGEEGSDDGEEGSDDGEEDSDYEGSEEELPPVIPVKEKKGKKSGVALPLKMTVAKPQKQPAQKQPAQKQPAQKQPAQKQPAQKQPAQKQPAQKQPAQKQPAQKQPAQKQSAQKAPKPNAPKVQKPQQPQVLKRKNTQPEVSSKKPKFEKKDKPRNKQFKKKNKA